MSTLSTRMFSPATAARARATRGGGGSATKGRVLSGRKGSPRAVGGRVKSIGGSTRNRKGSSGAALRGGVGGVGVGGGGSRRGPHFNPNTNPNTNPNSRRGPHFSPRSADDEECDDEVPSLASGSAAPPGFHSPALPPSVSAPTKHRRGLSGAAPTGVWWVDSITL